MFTVTVPFGLKLGLCKFATKSSIHDPSLQISETDTCFAKSRGKRSSLFSPL